MKVYMNTYCFMQDNEYAENEAMSYLGKKTFKQKLEIKAETPPKENGDDAENRSVYWDLKKKHIDLANKNDDIDADFSVCCPA